MIGFGDAVLAAGAALRRCKRCKRAFVAPTKRAEYCSIDCAQRYRNEKKKTIKEAKKKI
jgi:hypothetical protein